MKKNNKKGFTIVELVIVIAVIAILTAVLIPTFTSATEKAKESAAMQAARNEYELYLIENAETMNGSEDFYIKSGDYWYEVVDQQFVSTKIAEPALANDAIDLTEKKVVKSFTTPEDLEHYDDAPVADKYYETNTNNELTNEISSDNFAPETTYYYYGGLILADQNDAVAIYAKAA